MVGKGKESNRTVYNNFVGINEYTKVIVLIRLSSSFLV